ncbi:MAG: DUF1080 domain-containing protein [Planctomycetales bacterium]
MKRDFRLAGDGIAAPDGGDCAAGARRGDFTQQFVRYRNIRVKRLQYTPDNTLSEEEKKAGWKLLFDGKTYANWMNSNGTEPKSPIVDGTINPHRAGAYMVTYKEPLKNYVLKMDFKISAHCNSGIFLRTSTLKPPAGKDVGYYGIEVAIDDTYTADYHDTGAIYDLSKPGRNAMRPVGEWNHIEITSKDATIEVVLNGEKVNSIDLAKFVAPNKRPDGSDHKFGHCLQGSSTGRVHRPAGPRRGVLVQEHQVVAVAVVGQTLGLLVAGGVGVVQ